MRILKVINNNVVNCLDNDTELVVMGKGLGFGQKPGNSIGMENVEKVFRMDSMESKEDFIKLKELFSQLPPDLLEVCSQIIEHANHILGYRLNESIYLTLTDHIHFAIYRTKQGMYLHNALLTEVKVFYPKEYAIGEYALEYIELKQGVKLSEDEAASIALHLVNAEYDSSMSNTVRVTGYLQPMLSILENKEQLNLNKNHICYDELIVHLKFLAMQSLEYEKSWENSALVDAVRHSLSYEYECASEIAEFLKEQSGKEVSQTERAYLAICISRACEIDTK